MNARVKNIIFMLISFVLLVLLLSACDRETCCSDGSTGFSGFVTDSISDLPIDSARISLDDTLKGFSLYTDSTGFYEGVMFGGFDNLFVQKSGYITKSGNRQSGQFVVRIDFRLVPDSITGLPIDSAGISLIDTVAGASWFTDDSGYYRGAEFPSVHTLYVQKNGYKTKDTVIDLFKDLTNVNFQLVPDTTK